MQQNRESLFNGWHIPTLDEWLELGENSIIDLISEANSITDDFPNINYWNGTNDKKFNMLPSGKRGGGLFADIGRYAYFWTSTSNKCIYVTKNNGEYELKELYTDSFNQYAVRLIRDY